MKLHGDSLNILHIFEQVPTGNDLQVPSSDARRKDRPRPQSGAAELG